MSRADEQVSWVLARGDDTVVPEVAVAAVTSNGTARARSRGPSDYRLRGLDLDAHAFAEVPTRTVRRHPSLRRHRRRRVIQVIVVLAVIALVAILLRATLVEPYAVTSSSMAPTIRSGTDVLVVKSTFLTGPVGVGDVVVFRQPAGVSCGADNDSDQMVARVIGMPGDTIESKWSLLYVDGHRLHERGWYNPRYSEAGRAYIPPTVVPANSYFVLGDNRHETCDSRSFGAIPKTAVAGEVVASVLHDGHPYVHSM